LAGLSDFAEGRMQTDESFRKQTLSFHRFVSVPGFDVFPVAVAGGLKPAFTAIPVLEVEPELFGFHGISGASDGIAGITEELMEVGCVFSELLKISGAGIESQPERALRA
jgi:hypothetical protein